MEPGKKKKKKSNNTLRKEEQRRKGITPSPIYDYQIKSDVRPSYKDITVNEGSMIIAKHIKNVLAENFGRGLGIYVGKAVSPRRRWTAHQGLNKRNPHIKYLKMIVIEVFTDGDVCLKWYDSHANNEDLCLFYERSVLHILNSDKIPNITVMNDKGGSGDKSNGDVESTSLYVLIGELLDHVKGADEVSSFTAESIPVEVSSTDDNDVD